MDQVNQIERNNLKWTKLSNLFFLYKYWFIPLFFFFFNTSSSHHTSNQLSGHNPYDKRFKKKKKPYKSRVILFRDSKDQRFNHSIR